MERRVILAMGLSMLILFIWSIFILKFYPIENKEVREEISPILLPETKEEIKRFSTEKFDLEFLSSGIIKGINLRDYHHNFLLEKGFSIKERNKDLIFEPLFKEKEIVFLYKDEEKEISKVINFPKDKNYIDLGLKIRNLSDRNINLKLDLSFLSLDLRKKEEESRFWEIVLFKENKILRQSPAGIKREVLYKDIQVIGFRERYFCIFLRPKEKTTSLFVKREKGKVELVLPVEISFLPGQEESRSFLLYLHPQDKEILKSIDPRFSEIIYFGFFDSLSKFLLGLLEVLYRFCGNWGLAIILLAFFISFLFYPFTLKQLRSTKQIRALQPEINHLRALYKDNPKRLNREIIELYRKRKVNPFSGCLPFFLQIPIFISLYQGLMRSFNLKGARFLWIRDLSQGDKAFILFGKEINILPLLMIIAMFFQQKLISFGLTREQRQQQRVMNILLPIIFAFIFYNVPSGLVLYWFTQTVFTVLFQFRFKVVFPDMSE